jgi:hypothetical protein
MKPFKSKNTTPPAPARTLVQRVGDLEIAVKVISDRVNVAAPVAAPAAEPAK